MPNDKNFEQALMIKRNRIKNKFNIAKLAILLSAIVITAITFFIKSGVFQNVLIITAVILYISFFTVAIVMNNIIKKLKK